MMRLMSSGENVGCSGGSHSGNTRPPNGSCPTYPQAFAEFHMIRSVPTRFLTVLALKSQSEMYFLCCPAWNSAANLLSPCGHRRQFRCNNGTRRVYEPILENYFCRA